MTRPREARVSVLITSFQHERYIARALDSVLAQTGDVSFEVLVGDDASTDGTRAVIARYAAAHPGLVRTFLPERNLGLGGKAIFDELLERSDGEYVAMLDGDDFWTSPRKLERQARHLDEHPECSMCFHDVLCRYEDGSRPDAAFTGSGRPLEVGVRQLLDGIQIASCAPVFRRHAIHPLPGWYFTLPWGDAPLYVLAAERGAIHYLPEVMGVYRVHAGGMYRRLPRVRVLELQTQYYDGLRLDPAHEPDRRRRLAETWVKLGLEHHRLEDPAAARDCLRRSLRAHPLELRGLRHGPGERRRVALWLLLTSPTAVAHHPRLAAWRRRRAAG